METICRNAAYAFIHSRNLKIDVLLISVNSILKMVLTKEEEFGKTQILECLHEYNTASTIDQRNAIVETAYALLIQSTSLLSKFPKLRNIIQEKMIEYEQFESISEDFKRTIHQLKHVLSNLYSRDDYIA